MSAKSSSSPSYLVTTPYGKVVYESARDALGVFETTSGEYQAILPLSGGHAPVNPENVPDILAEIVRGGRLDFMQEGFSIEFVQYYESFGAK